jgi:hypothetical protein
MHLLALVVLAALLGAVYTFIQPYIAKVPAQSNRLVSALTVGAFILVALFLADLVVSSVGLRKG